MSGGHAALVIGPSVKVAFILQDTKLLNDVDVVV